MEKMKKDEREKREERAAPIVIDKTKKHTTSFVLLFLVGLVVGVLIAPLFWGNASVGTILSDTGSDDTVAKTAVASTTTTPTATSGYSVVVDDQLAGDRVLLKKVTFAKTGWAVVHEDNNGALGNALGAQRFEPGTYENVHVDLLRNTVTGNLYHVILYLDNGDGAFSLKSDTPLRDPDNAYIEDTFQTIRIDRKN